MSKELSITGKVIKVLPQQTGTGSKGAWFKQEFVIETNDQYPKKVCLSAWGDNCDMVDGLQKNEEVTVNFNVESREHNERWYTELRIWKIKKDGGVKTEKTGLGLDGEGGTVGSDEDDSLPF
jgi:hypothetical protein